MRTPEAGAERLPASRTEFASGGKLRRNFRVIIVAALRAAACRTRMRS